MLHDVSFGSYLFAFWTCAGNEADNLPTCYSTWLIFLYALAWFCIAIFLQNVLKYDVYYFAPAFVHTLI